MRTALFVRGVDVRNADRKRYDFNDDDGTGMVARANRLYRRVVTVRDFSHVVDRRIEEIRVPRLTSTAKPIAERAAPPLRSAVGAHVFKDRPRRASSNNRYMRDERKRQGDTRGRGCETVLVAGQYELGTL